MADDRYHSFFILLSFAGAFFLRNAKPCCRIFSFPDNFAKPSSVKSPSTVLNDFDAPSNQWTQISPWQ